MKVLGVCLAASTIISIIKILYGRSSGSLAFIADGIQAGHGFEALGEYDRPHRGGNGDGIVDASDAVWPRLRLWSDVNHDALTQRRELRPLAEFDVVALEIEYMETRSFDANGNWHRFRGYFHKWTRLQGRLVITRELMEDIFFRLVE